MAWKWEFTEKARDQFKKLDKTIQKRVIEKLNFWITTEKPLEFAEILVNYDLGTYRFRVGDYRIVFDIEDETIIVLLVGHRREIYK